MSAFFAAAVEHFIQERERRRAADRIAALIEATAVSDAALHELDCHRATSERETR